MKQKPQSPKSATRFVVFNLLAAAVVAIALFTCVILWLKGYTLHGKEITIPSVTGMTQEEAEQVLQNNQMFLVVVDSTFSNKAPLGTVVEQTPPALSHAKPGRPVYVVMNARTKRLVPLPELRDVSYRQAEATIKSLGLKILNVVYEPSLYPNNVLDMRDGDISLEAGTRLPEGTAITLVVGRRQGNKMVRVPSLLGMSLSQVRSELLRIGLTMGDYEYDNTPTPETLDSYIVYQQSPAEGVVIQEGSMVNIRLSTDLERAITTDQPQNEENFF